MPSPLEPIFTRLRRILIEHAGPLSVTKNNSACYCLEGRPGPATLQAWRGKLKRPTVPVAWVQLGKAYVSFHLMGIYNNSSPDEGISKALQARRQGKTCFNFKAVDEILFQELEGLTERACRAFQKAGFIQ